MFVGKVDTYKMFSDFSQLAAARVANWRLVLLPLLLLLLVVLLLLLPLVLLPLLISLSSIMPLWISMWPGNARVSACHLTLE